MKYLLLILPLLFLMPENAMAVSGDAIRFDFSAGQPTIVDNTTSTCNNTATIRYDFTSGMPTGVLDTTATCTVAASVVFGPPVLMIRSSTQIRNGQLMIK